MLLEILIIELMQIYGALTMHYRDPRLSDHSPLGLSVGEVDKSWTPFKIFNYVLKYKGFYNMVDES